MILNIQKSRQWVDLFSCFPTSNILVLWQSLNLNAITFLLNENSVIKGDFEGYFSACQDFVWFSAFTTFIILNNLASRVHWSLRTDQNTSVKVKVLFAWCSRCLRLKLDVLGLSCTWTVDVPKLWSTRLQLCLIPRQQLQRLRLKVYGLESTKSSLGLT